MKKVLLLLMVAVVFVFGSSLSYAALTPGATYTITVQKVNSNGSVSDFSTTSASADGSGKLTFSLSGMPTTNDANFIVFIITDSNGAVVRKGFVPAPPPGSTNLVGVNNLSTAQTNAILEAGTIIGSDDPIAVAYLITLLRSPGATEDDARILAALGKDAILGTGGFVGTLTANGVTSTQLTTFKQRLIYNPTAGKKTLADLTEAFKNAVDSGNDALAQQEMQKAGGFMAEVFMDAAEAAGIDFTLILAGHDAAGYVAENATNLARMAQLSAGVQKSLEQSMSSFFQRIAAVKVKSEYTKALTALNAPGSQVTTFNSAVSTMMTAMENIEATYSGYFMDPDGYISSNSTTHAVVQAAIEAAFQNAFIAFQNAIESSNADITTMKNNVAAAFGIAVGDLPPDFGKYYDFTGTPKNWPIPQVVMVNWTARIIGAGGDLGYTRDTTAVPAAMNWLGTCSNTIYFDQGNCTSNGGAWTPNVRHNFTGSTPSAEFNAYLGIQEDVQIAEFTRYSIYMAGTPTREQESQAKLDFETILSSISSKITGTTNGSTAISEDQKDAIVKMLMQPSMD